MIRYAAQVAGRSSRFEDTSSRLWLAASSQHVVVDGRSESAVSRVPAAARQRPRATENARHEPCPGRAATRHALRTGTGAEFHETSLAVWKFHGLYHWNFHWRFHGGSVKTFYPINRFVKLFHNCASYRQLLMHAKFYVDRFSGFSIPTSRFIVLYMLI